MWARPNGLYPANAISKAFFDTREYFQPPTHRIGAWAGGSTLICPKLWGPCPFIVYEAFIAQLLESPSPDGIPTSLMKDILNCSFSEGYPPPSWKTANIVPIPKQKPVKNVSEDLHHISPTPVLSKIAEELDFMKLISLLTERGLSLLCSSYVSRLTPRASVTSHSNGHCYRFVYNSWIY